MSRLQSGKSSPGDFADDLLPEENLVNPQQTAWQRQAVFSNLAAQGAAVQSVGPPGPEFLGTSQQSHNRPVWESWTGNEDHRMDMENSSNDSFPNSNLKMEQLNQSPTAGAQKLELDDFPALETASARFVLCIPLWHRWQIHPSEDCFSDRIQNA